MKRSREGFSLVELLITVVLLSVGILAVIGTISTMSRFQSLNATVAELSTLTQSKLDELRARTLWSLGDDTSIKPGPGGWTGACTGDATYWQRKSGSNGRLYCLSWEIREAGNDAPIGTRLIRVRGTLEDVFLWRPAREVATLVFVPPKV